MNKKTIITMTILITTFSMAQQIVNPNIKHEWENSRYIVNANNTVTDRKTGLVWKRCAQGLSGDNCTIGTASTHNWQAALDVADNSTFSGFSDWRIPNLKELRSLAAYDRYNPAINTTIFPNIPIPAPSSFFWGSSPWSGSLGDSASTLSSQGGNIRRDNRSEDHYVRLVRDGN